MEDGHCGSDVEHVWFDFGVWLGLAEEGLSVLDINLHDACVRRKTLRKRDTLELTISTHPSAR